MTQRLRRTLITGVLLLTLTVILWIRLDSDALHARFSEEVSSHTQATLQVESSALTFLHGIGLRLNQVSLEDEQFYMQAGHISISVRLLPLLMGEIEIDTLNIHDGLFKIRPDKLQPNTKALSGLPAKRLQLVRCRVETFDGDQLLDNLHLDLRNIGLNRTTLWELQAKQDNHSLSGHGRLQFKQGEITAGFGKLKLAQVPVSRLRPIVPQLLSRWLSQGDGHISGALTLDITERDVWSIFGDVTIDKNDIEIPVRFRGKLNQPGKGDLVWHDSFIHFDDQSVVAIDGSCHEGDCNTTIDAKNIALKKWAPFVPVDVSFHRMITGSTNLKSMIGWNKTGWRGTADFELFNGAFSHRSIETVLPALHLQVTEMSGNDRQWQTKVRLGFAKADGSIAIDSAKKKDGSKDMFIRSTDADGSQLQPLANLLLASLDIKPDLQLAGKISGALRLQQSSTNKELQLQLNADQAELSYKGWLHKPEGIQAQCQAHISWSIQALPGPVLVKLEDCQLANSSLTTLIWIIRKQRQSLSIDNLNINFDVLRTKSIELAKIFENIHGQIEGSASSTWRVLDNSTTRWLNNMSGSWRLQNLGSTSWHANGIIKAEKGTFSSSLLQLNGDYGQADLNGNFSISTKQGTINVIATSLDWDALPSAHASWNDIDLNGYIQYGQLHLLGNDWQNINSRYHLSSGNLELSMLEASLAGGSVSSRSLTLSPKAGALTVSGPIRIHNLQLQELQGLSSWLQSDLKGELHTNIKLQGSLPVRNMNEWKQSNGDILIYDGEWKQQSQAESITERLGIESPELQSYAFKKLEFRFRLHENQAEIPVLKLNRLEQSYSGSGSVNENHHLTGSIENSADSSTYTLDSILPVLNWSPVEESEPEENPENPNSDVIEDTQ